MEKEGGTEVGSKRDREEDKSHKEKKDKSRKEKKHKHEKKEKAHKEKSHHKEKSRSKDKHKERLKKDDMLDEANGNELRSPSMDANGQSAVPALAEHGTDAEPDAKDDLHSHRSSGEDADVTARDAKGESPEPGEILPASNPDPKPKVNDSPEDIGPVTDDKGTRERSKSPSNRRSRERERHNSVHRGYSDSRIRDSDRHNRPSGHSRDRYSSDPRRDRDWRRDDRGSSRGQAAAYSYREREAERAAGKRRTRSRSRSRENRHASRPRHSRSPPANRRRSEDPMFSPSHRHADTDVKSKARNPTGDASKQKEDDDEPVVAVLAESEDEDALIEARRNRWKNIKQKYTGEEPADENQNGNNSKVSDSTDKVFPSGDEAADADENVDNQDASEEQQENATSPPPKEDEQVVVGHDEYSAEDVELIKGDDECDVESERQPVEMDKAEGTPEILSGLEPGRGEHHEGKRHTETKGGAKSVDMFAEDADDDEDVDMFAKTPVTKQQPQQPTHSTQGLLDNWDDAEGYYKLKIGEVFGDNYQVKANQGKGVFSSVVRAIDLSKKKPSGEFEEVCVKVIRSNDVMYKAGQTEQEILNILAKEDKEGKRHCVRLLSSFEYRQHLCLVFESMEMNLRELIKKYGRDVGLNVNAVRQYAEQLMIGLHHMQRCKVVHADIKPDNILVNDRHTLVKFCDFGSAMYDGENEITPYLVSRFYRAPEIILGLPYGHPLDMWSLGCVLYELFTGKILFPGRTNNEMLKLMMIYKGPFPKKMLKKGDFSRQHFDAETLDNFISVEEDPVTKQPTTRLWKTLKMQTKTFSDVLARGGGDKKKVLALADLIDKCLMLDPEKRITPKQALAHPFFARPNADLLAAKRK